ncbi:hypothetical protein ACEWY4_002132 [Coilia grayii]|uniref:Protein SSUH2 homolog n=1 Tax=Coilia grayii TaxID=363190 RepID=A0ABD1KUX4_9TELE
MSADYPSAYRCDVILDPSQYTIVPPPHPERQHEKKHRPHRLSEIYHPATMFPLSEEDIIDIVSAWIKTQRYLCNVPAEEFALTPTNNDVVYCYSLETFTEQRSVCMRFEPQVKKPSQAINPTNQQPRPWMVAVSPVKMFCDQVCLYRLMNTDQCRGCPYCQEQKWLECPRCHGAGHRPCARSKAHQESPSKECSQCHGKRQVPCATCMALGRVCCRMCLGNGRLCYFKELRVEYQTHLENKLLNSCGVPEKDLLEAAGEVVHSSVGIRLAPLSQFSVAQVNEASQRMVERSHHRWPDCKVIQQRHLLKAVPVTYVQYDWKGQTGEFCIYGTDNRVYWPNHPQRTASDRCSLL